MCKKMNNKIVAVARQHNNSIFINKTVVAHHLRSVCISKTDKRTMNQQFLLALYNCKVLKRCSKCWTDRTWKNAFGMEHKMKYMTVENIMKEIEHIEEENENYFNSTINGENPQ